jgi:shikimate kinase
MVLGTDWLDGMPALHLVRLPGSMSSDRHSQGQPVPEGFELHPDRTDIVLLGQDGTATTEVGFGLARQLRRPFVSCESLFMAHEDRTPRDVFDQEGSEAYTAMQRRLAEIAMASRTSIVFAGASSMMCDDTHEFRETFGDAWVVWLDASPEVLARRIDPGERWRFGEDLLGALRREDERIRPILLRAADLRLDTERSTHDEQVAEVASTWERRRRNHSGSGATARAG